MWILFLISLLTFLSTKICCSDLSMEGQKSLRRWWTKVWRVWNDMRVSKWSQHFYFGWTNPLKYIVNCKSVCVRLTSCRPRVCLSNSETLSSDSSWLLCRVCSLSLKPWFCFLLFVRASRVLSNLSCAHITHTDKYEQASIHTCIITHPHPVLMRRLFFSSLLPVSCLFPLFPQSFPTLGSLFIGMSWQVSSKLKKIYTEATVFLFVQHF